MRAPDTLIDACLRLGRNDPEAAKFVLDHLRSRLGAPIPAGVLNPDSCLLGRLEASIDIVSDYVDAGAGSRTPRERAS